MKTVVFLAALALSGTASAQGLQTCAAYAVDTDQTIQRFARQYMANRISGSDIGKREKARAKQCFGQYVADIRSTIARQCLTGGLDTDTLREQLLLVAERCEAFGAAFPGPVVPLPTKTEPVELP